MWSNTYKSIINLFTTGVPHMRHPEQKKLPGIPPVWCCIGARAPTQQQAAADTWAESGPAPRTNFVAARKLLFSASKYIAVKGLKEKSCRIMKL